MKNYVQMGKTLDFTASAAISSGDIVKVGAFVGVALADYANGEDGVMCIDGVYEVAALGTDDISKGDLLYFDESESEMTLSDDSGSNAKAGYAFADSGTGVETVKIKLER